MMAKTSAFAILNEGFNRLALITARIEAYYQNTRVGVATGFFFSSSSRNLFLITNRHVVNNPSRERTRLVLQLHTDRVDITKSAPYEIALYHSAKPVWREVDPNTDVVAIEVPPDLRAKYSLEAFSPSNFIPPDVVLGLGDPLLIVGYPRGFYDAIHNLPVVRQGSVASVFPIPFENNPFFLVDAILHKGTSGSPVVTQPANVYRTRGGTLAIGPHERLFLAGINSGYYKKNGETLNLNMVWFNEAIQRLTI